jgi:hypothetical protein
MTTRSDITVRNGWLTCNGQPLIGLGHENDCWGGLTKADCLAEDIKPYRDWLFALQPHININRRAPDTLGPAKTEDLTQVADTLTRLGLAAYEHYYGLWYDRRRDMHDAQRKRPPQTDTPTHPWDNPIPPFYEQPWARSGEGLATDGKTLYDLTRYNAWYFDRLRTFATLCAERSMLLLHGHHNQHTVLENTAHYADYAWNPANCIQDLPMPPLPDTICITVAREFYDVSDPTKRALHRDYIRHCLDVLSGTGHVMHKHGREYTGPLTFTQFWLDTIIEWKRDTGKPALACLCATKDVTDAILADGARRAHVDAVDLRGWWYQADGTLYAPLGGQEDQSGRYQGEIEQTTAHQLYRQVREYRLRYPNIALIHAARAPDIAKQWALLTGGASLNITRLDPIAPGTSYEGVTGGESFAPTAAFIRERLGPALLTMVPTPSTVNRPDENWCLADATSGNYLIFASAGGDVKLTTPGEASAPRVARWFDPTTGDLHNAGDNDTSTWSAPAARWALWITARN